MMKKILLSLIALLTLSGAAHQLKAQTPYLGGSLTAAYSTTFTLDATLLGGYEFNDRWAVGAGLGLGVAPATMGMLGLYARYTPWHNDILYTDLTLRTEGYFTHGINLMDLGLVGSLRFRVSEHVDIFTDIASVGIRWTEDEAIPLIGIFGETARVGLHYRF